MSPGGSSPLFNEAIEHKSTRTDLVTEVDRASETLIVEALRRARPNDGILAEEGGSSEGTSGFTWVVDPLDGTVNFVYGVPIYGVSMACVDDEGAFVGVVHDPTREELFSAVRGEGAFLNGERLGLRPGPELAEALVGTGFSYDSERRAAQGRLVSSVLPAVRDIRRAGAAAIDLCWVAAGRLDAFYESDLAPWDHAAGSLVVREAGGSAEELGGLLGGEPTLVAAAPGLGEHLAALLVAASGPPRGPDARPW